MNVISFPMPQRGTLARQRAELIQSIEANIREHEVNLANAERAGDAGGVRIAQSGIERCRLSLDVLNGSLRTAA